MKTLIKKVNYWSLIFDARGACDRRRITSGNKSLIAINKLIRRGAVGDDVLLTPLGIILPNSKAAFGIVDKLVHQLVICQSTPEAF